MLGEVPVHPLLVHLPIALILLAPFLGLGLLLLLRKEPVQSGLWRILVFWHILLTFSIYAAMTAGEWEREKIVDPVAISRIQAHEDAATLLLLFSLPAIAVAALGIRENSRTFFMRIGLIVVQVFLLLLCVRTAHLGGELVYRYGIVDELRNVSESPVGQ